MKKIRILSATLLLAVVSVGAHGALAEHPPHVERPTAGASAPLPLAAVGGDHPGEFLTAFAAWAQGVTDEEQAQQEREAQAAMASTGRSAVGGTTSRGTYEGVGDCSGFAIPDHIIRRESGGDPYAVNSSSGAWGCAQVMPFHWSPGGACAGLDRYSIDDQRTCVDWLSEGGTRLSPWAATR